MLKLGTEVKDIASNQLGMLTLMQIEMNDSTYYYFQPKGVNPKTGEPVDGRWVVDATIEDAIKIPDPDLPLEVLGSHATDMASGYTGMIISLRLHLNGCCHVSIQSSQLLETGNVPQSVDFDLRRLVGDKIKILDEVKLEESKLETPSPMNVKPYRPR